MRRVIKLQAKITNTYVIHTRESLNLQLRFPEGKRERESSLHVDRLIIKTDELTTRFCAARDLTCASSIAFTLEQPHLW